MESKSLILLHSRSSADALRRTSILPSRNTVWVEGSVPLKNPTAKQRRSGLGYIFTALYRRYDAYARMCLLLGNLKLPA